MDIAEEDDIYDPRMISKISLELYPQPVGGSEGHTLKETVLPVHLVDKVDSYSDLNYSVWPVISNGIITRWIDPSGYELAKGEAIQDLADYNVGEYDFILRPKKSDVLIKKYF